MTPKKLTYYVLAQCYYENIGYMFKLSETPFDMAPLDTYYGQDFDIMVYTDENTQPLDLGDIVFLMASAAKDICVKTGMTFCPQIGPTQNLPPTLPLVH